MAEELPRDEEGSAFWGRNQGIAYARYFATWPADERSAWCRAMVEGVEDSLSASAERETLKRQILKLPSLVEAGRSMADIVAAFLAMLELNEDLAAREGMVTVVRMMNFDENRSQIIMEAGPEIIDFRIPEVPGGGLADFVPAAEPQAAPATPAAPIAAAPAPDEAPTTTAPATAFPEFFRQVLLDSLKLTTAGSGRSDARSGAAGTIATK